MGYSPPSLAALLIKSRPGPGVGDVAEWLKATVC